MILIGVIIGLAALFGFVVMFGAPYVPSLTKEVRLAFDELYPVGKGDVVIDLGSGDGRVLRQAALRGAKVYGYELNPLLVIVSRLVAPTATVRLADMYTSDIPDDTTLLYAFSVSRDGRRLGRYVQRQADRLGRPISVITFGCQLKGHEPTRVQRAHSLYTINPMTTKTLTV